MDEQKVEPPKAEPKHYGMEIEPGEYVFKLGTEPAPPKPLPAICRSV